MELKLQRTAKRDSYTIGKMSIDGTYFCDTLEDKDRGLTDAMSEAEIASKKVKGQTAIPTGRYRVDMNTVSTRFGSQAFYRENANGGCVPRLEGVKGFLGILIHVGNTDKDTEGCILVGKNNVVGQVTASRDTFKSLYKRLQEARGEIWIQVE